MIETITTSTGISAKIINALLGLVCTAILTVGVNLITTMNDLRQEIAVIKNMIVERDKLDITTRETLHDHEMRLRNIEIPHSDNSRRKMEYHNDSIHSLIYR